MLTLSDNLQAALDSRVFEQVLILEIEGLPVCASAPLSKILRFDDEDFYFDEGAYLDSPFRDRKIEVLIDIKNSSNSFSQQLNQDQSGSSSAQTFSVALVDMNGIVTEWITPGLIIDEILGKKAKVYLNVKDGVHPQDSLMLMSGIIDGFTAGENRVNANIVSAENLKKGSIFLPSSTTILDYPPFSTTLTADVPAGQGNFPCASIAGFPEPGNDIYYGSSRRRYLIKIGSDILSYSRISGSSLVWKMTGELTQAHGAYANGTTVEFYRVLTAGSIRAIDLADASGFLPPSIDGILETYVKIDDEIIKYGAVGPGRVSTLSRGQLGTVAADHDFGATVETFYKLSGNMKDLALKLMLSGGEKYFFSSDCDTVTSDGATVANAVFFENARLLESGVSIGDFVDLFFEDGSIYKTGCIIQSFGSTTNFKYAVVDQALVAHVGLTASLRSKYNTLPDGAGLGLSPDVVDVAEHELLYARFFTQLFDLTFYLTSEVTGRELINNQIYYPNGAIPIPRKGKASVGIIAPPLAGIETITIDDSNVESPSKIKLSRSINQNFYNAVLFKYDLDLQGQKYNANTLFFSAVSTNRIKVPTKPLTIKADGIKYSPAIENKINSQSKRFLERFQFGAEVLENVKVRYSVGVRLEVGDSVIFDGRKLNVSDSAKRNGTRQFNPRVMEISNKTTRPFSKEVTLSLIDTSYALNARYGVFGPASKIAELATSTVLPLKISYSSLVDGGPETKKWNRYIGEYVLVRSRDWTYSAERKIVRLDEAYMVLEVPLPFTPLEDYMVETPSYPDNADKADHELWKALHVYFTPQVKVSVDSVLQDRFTVAALDISKFLAGAVVTVHDKSYNDSSEDRIIKQVLGNVVILDKPLGFIPTTQHLVDLIGFKDGGEPYRWA